jgi:large subunit ribosomal protein L23
MVWNRLRFPNMAVTYVAKTAKTRLAPNQHIFRVEPSCTKHDIKEYLQKIYNLPVVKVNTMNYEGKFKRALQGRRVYKEKDWKKAIVTLAK